MVRVAIFSILYLIFNTGAAYAQFADVLSIVPPTSGLRTGNEAVARVESPSLILETALIQWKLDGVEVARGIGKVEVPLTLTDTNEHQLEVTVAEQAGVTRTEKTNIKASDIDILWEAETLVPSLYRGRPLPSVESTIRAEVHIHGKKNTAPGTHIYTWSINGRRLATQSGIGKNNIRIALPTFENSALLQVSVVGIAGDFTGQTSVRIQTVDPRVVFYEKKPLLGLWIHTPLARIQPLEQGVTLSAFPYFLSSTSQNDTNLSYSWSLGSGNTPAEGEGAKPSDVLIKNAEGFSVSVIHKKTLLQEARGRGALQPQTDSEGSGSFGI